MSITCNYSIEELRSITFRTSDEVRRKLDEEAGDREVSRSKLLADIVESHIKHRDDLNRYESSIEEMQIENRRLGKDREDLLRDVKEKKDKMEELEIEMEELRRGRSSHGFLRRFFKIKR